ncbi:MAG: PDZ domain-containing protein [Phycisphaerales bacterium JB061]
MRMLTLAFLVMFSLPTFVSAQEKAPESDKALKAFQNQDFDEAERLWTQWADRDPQAFVPMYNLACARSLRGDTKGASEYMLTAIERGFADINQLERDPNLKAFRKTDTYKQLVDAWPTFLDRRVEADLDAARKTYGSRYNYTKDSKYRLAFASSYDTITSRQAREEVRRTAEWAYKNVFHDLRDTSDGLDPWVMVVLPTQSHFAVWANETYGQLHASATSQLGGAYAHDQKKLVTQDLGSTLRHEFFHVLHWRSADRLGQRHPVWIQEGLASIVEDMDQTRQGRWEPAVSWRTNSIARLAKQNKLTKIEQLTSMPRSRFAGSRPLSNYAHARAVFMYLHEQRKLAAFYKQYTDNYSSDPSGLTALLETLDTTTKEFDEDLRQWARGLEMVHEQNSPPALGIGVVLDVSPGDGPIVRQITHNSAKDAGLRPGDILTGMNGRSVRDLNEFYRVLTGLSKGQRVEITYRRRSQHKSGTVEITGRK